MYSVWFLISKKNGGQRPILDLKWLNRFLQKQKFKLETWRSILAALDQGDYLTSAGLTEAYLHVPILKSHCKYLQFSYSLQQFQLRAVPFGLTSTPRLFTKFLMALVAHLRIQGISLFPFLDDILIKAPSRDQALRDTQTTLLCLQKHGFVVNRAKCLLDPCQSIIHLGLQVDMANFQVSLSPDHQASLSQSLTQLQSQNSSNLMILA